MQLKGQATPTVMATEIFQENRKGSPGKKKKTVVR